MRRITTNLAEIRKWAEVRLAVPVLNRAGGLALLLPGRKTDGIKLDWIEFAGFFTADKLAFAYDEEPGSELFEIVMACEPVRGHGQIT